MVWRSLCQVSQPAGDPLTGDDLQTSYSDEDSQLIECQALCLRVHSIFDCTSIASIRVRMCLPYPNVSTRETDCLVTYCDYFPNRRHI